MTEQKLQPYYTNPVVDGDFPDPSVIWVEKLGFFAYATHDEFSPTINNILVKQSWDLINWSATSGALISQPLWAMSCQRFWCPHVVQVNKQFRLYYAAEPDTKDGMCIAMAMSDTPYGFTDCGSPVSRLKGSTYQMIDPCFFVDPVTGRHLLYYGSAHEPIKVVEVAADGMTLLGEPVSVLYPGEGTFHKLREGAFVTYDKKWKRYFLWVSGDNTWAGQSYAVSVFWSADPTAVFIKIPGDNVIVKPNEHWDSPGQNCIITDMAGTDWIIYHAVDTKERFIAATNIFLRKMCMDRVLYTNDGWPYVDTGSPSYTEQPGPVVAR